MNPLLVCYCLFLKWYFLAIKEAEVHGKPQRGAYSRSIGWRGEWISVWRLPLFATKAQRNDLCTKNHTNISGQKLYALRFGSPTWLADSLDLFTKSNFLMEHVDVPFATIWVFRGFFGRFRWIGWLYKYGLIRKDGEPVFPPQTSRWTGRTWED